MTCLACMMSGIGQLVLLLSWQDCSTWLLTLTQQQQQQRTLLLQQRMRGLEGQLRVKKMMSCRLLWMLQSKLHGRWLRGERVPALLLLLRLLLLLLRCCH
jgi:hypothetical protein